MPMLVIYKKVFTISEAEVHADEGHLSQWHVHSDMRMQRGSVRSC